MSRASHDIALVTLLLTLCFHELCVLKLHRCMHTACISIHPALTRIAHAHELHMFTSTVKYAVCKR
jgi:hypothetical protein